MGLYSSSFLFFPTISRTRVAPVDIGRLGRSKTAGMWIYASETIVGLFLSLSLSLPLLSLYISAFAVLFGLACKRDSRPTLIDPHLYSSFIFKIVFLLNLFLIGVILLII